MIAETYVCSRDNQLIEYGYCFKRQPGDADSILDLPLGVTQNEVDIEPALASFKELADSIALTIY